MIPKVALVTGASKGIGRATALALARNGMQIVATARNLKELESLNKEIIIAGGECLVYPADLTREDDLESLLDVVHTAQLQIDLLVHSAGLAKVGKIENMPYADWQNVLTMNLSVPFHLTQKSLPMINDGGHVIFINSVAGKASFSEWSAYCAAKHGLRALAEVLRQEVSARKIKVTSIYPASVDTALHNNLPYSWDRSKMLTPAVVADAILTCYRQAGDVVIKNLEIENAAGVF